MNIRKSASSVSSKVQKFKPSKKVVIGAVIVGVLALLFLFGMIQQVRKDNQDRAVTAAQTAEFNDLKAKNPVLQARVTELEGKLAKEHEGRVGACDYIGQKAKQRQTAPYIVLPVIYCS